MPPVTPRASSRTQIAKTSAAARRGRPPLLPDPFQAPLTELPQEPKPTVERRAKAEPPPEPMVEEPELDPVESVMDPDRPQHHNGVQVIEEELISFLPNGAAFRISKLHLADGGLAYACRDCLETADKRVDIQRHRNAEHGAKFGKKPPKVVFAADKAQLIDFVLPPRENGPAPADPMRMTLAEILGLMPTLAAASDLIEHLEYERDAAIKELKRYHDNKHKIDVYEVLQDEVVELRLKMKEAGSYDELRAELLALRAWKRNMIKRMSSLGFTFDNEE